MSKPLFETFIDNPKLKGKLCVDYRKATEDDAFKLSELIYEKDRHLPNIQFSKILERTHNELKDIDTLNDYEMFLALYEGEVIGYGRSIYYDQAKRNYDHPAPDGWYLMGLYIAKEYRNYGIARKLIEIRLASIKEKSDEVYYVVNAQNEVSIRAHESHGFEVLSKASGYLKVTFSGGKGYLLRAILK